MRRPPDSRVDLVREVSNLPHEPTFVRPSYRSIGMLGGCRSVPPIMPFKRKKILPSGKQLGIIVGIQKIRAQDGNMSSSSSSSSSAPPININSSGDDGLVPGEEQAVRAWLVQQGFEPGDLRSEKKIDYIDMVTPMMRACFKGELNVCKWLYNHGAAEDISRADIIGNTPMIWACNKGCLLYTSPSPRD